MCAISRGILEKKTDDSTGKITMQQRLMDWSLIPYHTRTVNTS